MWCWWILIDIAGKKMYNVTLHDFWFNKKVCSSCMLYVILLIMICILVVIGISGTRKWYYCIIIFRTQHLPYIHVHDGFVFSKKFLHDIYVTNDLYDWL